MRLASTPKYRGLTLGSKTGPIWTGEVRLWEPALDLPLRWRKPRMIFVNSMSDLFHESVPDEWIDRIFAVMALCPQHTFQCLTKRAERMRAYCSDPNVTHRVAQAMDALWADSIPWPLGNVWKGVSIEDQARADERIPLLLDTPAALRWVSAEPLLAPTDISYWLSPNRLIERDALDWVVVGGESGHRARRFNTEWARSIIAQCRTAGVRVFLKQLGSHPYLGLAGESAAHTETMPPSINRIRLRDSKGGNPEEWPPELRVREFPVGLTQ